MTVNLTSHELAAIKTRAEANAPSSAEDVPILLEVLDALEAKLVSLRNAYDTLEATYNAERADHMADIGPEHPARIDKALALHPVAGEGGHHCIDGFGARYWADGDYPCGTVRALTEDVTP
jgi:hypothetical protein